MASAQISDQMVLVIDVNFLTIYNALFCWYMHEENRHNGGKNGSGIMDYEDVVQS